MLENLVKAISKRGKTGYYTNGKHGENILVTQYFSVESCKKIDTIEKLHYLPLDRYEYAKSLSASTETSKIGFTTCLGNWLDTLKALKAMSVKDLNIKILNDRVEIKGETNRSIGRTRGAAITISLPAKLVIGSRKEDYCFRVDLMLNLFKCFTPKYACVDKNTELSFYFSENTLAPCAYSIGSQNYTGAIAPVRKIY